MGKDLKCLTQPRHIKNMQTQMDAPYITGYVASVQGEVNL